jgi:outer membrane receptor for ferrienterochelin and colicins
MIYKKIMFLTIFVIAAAWIPLKSASIIGSVSDASSGKVLQAVRVDVIDKLFTTFSDKNGEFSLSKLPAGNYRVNVQCDRYIPMEFKVSLKEDGIHRMKVQLHRDALLRHEILVTGTRTNHTVGDIPVAAEVITDEEIKERNLKDIQDVFDSLSGVRVRRTSGTWGNKGNIELQGMDSRHTLVLVDGQKYMGGHGCVDIASIPVNMIKKVELVKGPSSVLYGSDAMGGVVNIITRNGFDIKNSINLSSSFGSDNTRVYEAAATYNYRRFGATVAFTKKGSDGITKETDGISEDMLTGNFNYRISRTLSLSLAPRYEYSKLNYEERTQKRFVVNSTLQWSNNQGSVLKLRGSLFNYNHATGDLVSDWDNNLVEMELTGTHMFSKHHLVTGGYHLERETIDDRGKEYEADQTIHSVFLQDEIAYKPVTLVLGARIDSHNLWGETFNPKASLNVDLTARIKLRASVGRAFRAPKLVKLHGQWNMGPFLVMPNSELEPEKSVGFQVGGEWHPVSSIFLKAAYFNQDVSDLITSRYNRSKRPWILSWFNVDRALIRGVDMSLKAAVSTNVVLRSSYTYVDAEDKDSGEPLLNRPKHAASLGFNWNIPSLELGLNMTANYTGRRLVEMEVDSQDYVITSISPFTTVDVSITKRIARYIRLHFSVRNLFDKKDVVDEYNLDGTKIFGGFDINL